MTKRVSRFVINECMGGLGKKLQEVEIVSFKTTLRNAALPSLFYPYKILQKKIFLPHGGNS